MSQLRLINITVYIWLSINSAVVVYININGNHGTGFIQLHCFVLVWEKTKENSLDTMWWGVNLPVPPRVSCGWSCAPGRRVVWTKSRNCWPPNHHSSQPACDTTRMKQVSNQWYISERERDKERDRLRERQTGRERDRNRDRERDSYKYGDSKIFYVNTAEFMDSDKNAKLNIQYWYCIHFFFSLNKLDSKIGLWLFYNNNLLKTQTPTLKLPGKIGEENVFCTYCSRYFFLWVGIRCVFLTCRYQIYTELHQGVTQQNHVVYSVKGCSVSKRLK